MVIDVRPDDRISEADAEAFAVTAQACSRVGWEFRRIGEIEPVLRHNQRWLGRYRHPRCAGQETITRRLREVFAGPTPLLVGAEEIGDRLAVLPALFHSMWRQDLVADLAGERLNAATLVRAAEPAEHR